MLVELNTAAKIKQTPMQIALLQSKPYPIAALLWNHMLVLLDIEKNWVIFDIDAASVIHPEVDGLRLISTRAHEFVSVVQSPTKAVYSPSGPGALLIDAFGQGSKIRHSSM